MLFILFSSFCYFCYSMFFFFGKSVLKCKFNKFFSFWNSLFSYVICIHVNISSKYSELILSSFSLSFSLPDFFLLYEICLFHYISNYYIFSFEIFFEFLDVVINHFVYVFILHHSFLHPSSFVFYFFLYHFFSFHFF